MSPAYQLWKRINYRRPTCLVGQTVRRTCSHAIPPSSSLRFSLPPTPLPLFIPNSSSIPPSGSFSVPTCLPPFPSLPFPSLPFPSLPFPSLPFPSRFIHPPLSYLISLPSRNTPSVRPLPSSVPPFCHSSPP